MIEGLRADVQRAASVTKLAHKAPLKMAHLSSMPRSALVLRPLLSSLVCLQMARWNSVLAVQGTATLVASNVRRVLLASGSAAFLGRLLDQRLHFLGTTSRRSGT